MKSHKKGHEALDKTKADHETRAGDPSGEEPGTPPPPAETPVTGKTDEAGGPEKTLSAAPQPIETPLKPVLTETEQLKDRLLRLQADFDNFRKRTVREKMDTIRRANEDLLLALLPILDNLELTLEHAREKAAGDAFIEGVRIVRDEFIGILQKFGVTPLETVGQPFDTAWHEAIARLPSADKPEGTILVQTRRGYMLGDSLLRPAQVVVAAPSAESEASPAPSEQPAEQA